MSLAASSLTKSGTIERFKAFYRELKPEKFDQIEELYAPAIIFKDPVHQIRGVDYLHRYFVDLCADLDSCRFEFLDELSQHDSCYIKWDMHFSHPRLGQEVISVRGMTQLKLKEEKIIYHEDVYDLGAMLYEHLPLIGSATRWLKKRLATANTES